MALVTLAFRRSEADRSPDGSGFLVPPVDGRAIKAATFSATSGAGPAHADPALFVPAHLARPLRRGATCSGTTPTGGLSPRDLAPPSGWARAPSRARVTRWDGGLPQYPVGHLGQGRRGPRSTSRKLPGLAVCGAVYEGVGIPACVAQRDAARPRQVLGTLRAAAEPAQRGQ